MWTIIPREPDLSRLYDPLSKWFKLTLFERHNEPHTWTITGPLQQMEMFDEGAGSILFSDNTQVASGEVLETSAGSTTDSQGHQQETMTATFASDFIVLGDRVIVPSPTFAMPTGSIFNFPAAYDLRSGAIETLIIDYIRAHAGDLAVTNRQVPRLRVPTSQGRGGTTQVSGRFDNLGTLVSSLAEAGNLRVEVKHVEDVNGAWLDVVIEPVADLSADIRFGSGAFTSAGRITNWTWRKQRPTTTRVLVAGGGELAARNMVHLTRPPAETTWNRAVEILIDQRQVQPGSANELAELTRAGTKALDEGEGLREIRFVPQLGGDVVFRRDLRVGDIVGYDLPRLPAAKDKIRQVRTDVTVESGQPTEQITITVGTPDAPEDPIGGQTARALRDVRAIERSQ